MFGANLTPFALSQSELKYAKIVHYATVRYCTHIHYLVQRCAVWDVVAFPVVAGEAKGRARYAPESAPHGWRV